MAVGPKCVYDVYKDVYKALITMSKPLIVST